MMKCQGKTASGKPCKMPVIKGTRLCFTHSPETRAAQAAARKLGGYRSATPHAGDASKVIAQPRTIEEIYSIYDYALAETVAMDNSVQRNRLLTSIGNAYVDARKVGELETQLMELMRILGSRQEAK